MGHYGTEHLVILVVKSGQGQSIPSCSVDKILPSDPGGVGLIPSQGTKIPHALHSKNQNLKQKQYCNTFNKAFKHGPHHRNLKNKRMNKVDSL